MIRSTLSAGSLAALLACGGADFRSADESDAGGSAGSAAGGSAGSPQGGSAQAGASQSGSGGSLLGANCEQLWMNYQSELDQARLCNRDSTVNQCTATLKDACGCEVPVNAASGHYQSARQRYDAYTSAACISLPCGRLCTTTTDPACRSGMSGGNTICSW